MPPVRTVYVPRFSSQLSSSQSQRDEPEPDQTRTRTTQRDQSGNQRADKKTRFLLKVKLQKHNSTLSKKGTTKEDKTPSRVTIETAANVNKTTERPGGAGIDSDSVGRDVFFFSQRPTSTAMNEKEKAKHAVLRTISKMLEENQLIRQRLVAISQAN